MLLLRSIDSRRLPDQGCVLTIGNFDGVHLGHQEILSHIVKVSTERNLPSVVMTFLPSPEEFFQSSRAAPRLTNLTSRYFAIREQGVDILIALPFDRNLAQTGAIDFVQDYLVDRLKVSYLLVGDDFRFGKARQGDFKLLEAMSAESGFTVDRFETVSDEITRISSTRVREHLALGQLDEASALLGRNYAMCGRVSHGDKRGRTWGFPTLNIPVHHDPPMTGIFAVEVTGVEESALPGAASLGTRPTIGGTKVLLEVHLFDFDREIYGHRICVEFVAKIRDEEKFDTFDELKAQIMKDCERAKSILRDRSHG